MRVLWVMPRVAFPVILNHLFFPTLERPDLSSQYQLSSCRKRLGEAAGVRDVRAVTRFSSQLSKASETSDCGEDLQVSNRSDHELIRPTVSHEKLRLPWAWASCSHLRQSSCPTPELLSDDLAAVAWASVTLRLAGPACG